MRSDARKRHSQPHWDPAVCQIIEERLRELVDSIADWLVDPAVVAQVTARYNDLPVESLFRDLMLPDSDPDSSRLAVDGATAWLQTVREVFLDAVE